MPQTFHHLTRLRSAVGEREKWSGDGETAGTKAERNAAAEPQTEARRCCGQHPLLLVTSARIAEWNGRRREGDGATGSLWSAAIRALVTAGRQV